MFPCALGPSPVSSPLELLCLGAHSDDIEIGCGGTLLRLLREHPGTAVHWVVFSATPEREREARRSGAAFLAAAAESSIAVKGYRESFFPYSAIEIKEFFEELKRTVQPDVIFCHHRHDQHQDHRLLAELCWNTFRNHLVFEYEIPKYEGDLGTPNVYVPLSRDDARHKVEVILTSFSSQASRSWFRADTFEALMSLRGIECNAPQGKAEAFHVRKLVL